MVTSEEWSGITIVILIAFGVLILTVLLIFLKRQIMRLKLRSRTFFHVTTGYAISKKRKKEMSLSVNTDMEWEPVLQNAAIHNLSEQPYYYRLLAMDDLKLLEKELQTKALMPDVCFGEALDVVLGRVPQMITKDMCPVMEEFCDLYNWARYDSIPFEEMQYKRFRSILDILINRKSDYSTFKIFTLESETRKHPIECELGMATYIMELHLFFQLRVKDEPTAFVT